MKTSSRKQVVIGLLGPILDSSRFDASRWERWRPTVCVCQQEDLVVSRFELLHQPEFSRLGHTIASDIQVVSPETEVRLHNFPMNDAWDFEEVFGALHDFARSYPFDPEQEDYLVHITTGTHVAQICLFLLIESRHIPARIIQTSPPSKRRGGRAGAGPGADSDLPCRDVGSYSLIDLDLSRYDRLATRFEHEQVEATSFLKSGIETRNSGFNALIDQIERVAVGSSAPILLTGPTGAGKSHLARRIYELKKARRQVSGAFVEVNCATLRGDGAMSALFGHRRGAFTGALQDRPGLLRTADAGIVFLDEVGELGPDEQAMLLRAVEEKRFLPVGSDKEVSSDFQLIAGTNRDLAEAVREGKFRDDLLARLNLWTFCLPGLRERTEDIEPNFEFELDRFARTHGRRVTCNKEAREKFLRFATSQDAAWSANFRDLGAAVTRMATLATTGRITTEIVEAEIKRLEAAWRGGSGAPFSQGGGQLEKLIPPHLLNAERTNLHQPVDRVELVQLQEVLQICRASRTQSEAGRQLYAVSRLQRSQPNDADRLRKYLGRYGLDWHELKDFWAS